MSKRITGRTQMPIKLSRLEAEVLLIAIWSSHIQDEYMFEKIFWNTECIYGAYQNNSLGVEEFGWKNNDNQIKKIIERCVKKLSTHADYIAEQQRTI